MSAVDVQNGETPLLVAAGRGHVEIVRLLLDAHPRADVDRTLNTVGAHQRRQYRPTLATIVGYSEEDICANPSISFTRPTSMNAR